MCNGTRLVVTDLCNKVNKSKITTGGGGTGKEAHIPNYWRKS